MDCSPPGSSIHGILQARILEWVAIPFSRISSQPGDQTQGSHIAGSFFTIWAIREVQLLVVHESKIVLYRQDIDPITPLHHIPLLTQTHISQFLFSSRKQVSPPSSWSRADPLQASSHGRERDSEVSSQQPGETCSLPWNPGSQHQTFSDRVRREQWLSSLPRNWTQVAWGKTRTPSRSSTKGQRLQTRFPWLSSPLIYSFLKNQKLLKKKKKKKCTK